MRAKRGELPSFLEEALEYCGDECLIWPYSNDSKGYPALKLFGKMTRISKIICNETYGSKPTIKHEVAHSCGCKLCVNPKHLRWATPKENRADQIVHGTHNCGSRNGHAKLTDIQVHSIRVLYGMF